MSTFTEKELVCEQAFNKYGPFWHVYTDGTQMENIFCSKEEMIMVMTAIAVMTRQEIAFAIMGGLFVAEAISVILQVGSFKLRKKRVLLMAPLHHHFEELGWKETQVVVRFWIVAILLVVLGLMTLKLR